jgi:MFS family permease
LDVLKIRGVVVPSLVTLTLGLSYGTTYSFLPLFARDHGMGNAGFFFTVMSILTVVSRSVAGGLSDRVGRLSVALPMLGVLALSLMGLNWTYALGVLMLMAALQGIGLGGARVGAEAMVVDNAPSDLRGTSLSLLYFCFDLGIGTSGLVIGVVATLWGYGAGYLLVGVVCLLTLLLFAGVMRKPGRA